MTVFSETKFTTPDLYQLHTQNCTTSTSITLVNDTGLVELLLFSINWDNIRLGPIICIVGIRNTEWGTNGDYYKDTAAAGQKCDIPCKTLCHN